MLAQPRRVTGHGDRAHRGNLENSVRDDVVAQMLLREEDKTSAVACIGTLWCLTVERQRASIRPAAELPPRRRWPVDFHQPFPVQSLKQVPLPLVPVSAEVRDFDAPVASQLLDRCVDFHPMRYIVVGTDLALAANTDKDVLQEPSNAVGDRQIAIIRQQVGEVLAVEQEALPPLMDHAKG